MKILNLVLLPIFIIAIAGAYYKLSNRNTPASKEYKLGDSLLTITIVLLIAFYITGQIIALINSH